MLPICKLKNWMAFFLKFENSLESNFRKETLARKTVNDMGGSPGLVVMGLMFWRSRVRTLALCSRWTFSHWFVVKYVNFVSKNRIKTVYVAHFWTQQSVKDWKWYQRTINYSLSQMYGKILGHLYLMCTCVKIAK